MSAVLIVEDERHLADGLRYNLEAEGYEVEIAADGETALALLLGPDARFDAVVLDVMLPGKDGFEVAAELRGAGRFVPVLMLTARGRPEDVLRGLESGADDYLPKPFDLSVLIARLNGLLRRREWARLEGRAATAQAPRDETAAPTAGDATDSARDATDSAGDAPGARAATGGVRADATGDELFVFAGKTIDFGSLELRTRDGALRLTLMEAELLRHLVGREGRIVSRKSLLEEVWGLHEDTDTRAIDNFVVRLRKYIEDEPSRPRHLTTVRGVGYRFVAEPEERDEG